MKNALTKFLLFKFSRPLILIVLVIVFTVFTDTFWAPGNWTNISNIILQQAPFSVLLATAMTMTIILNGFDLSIGASVAFISCVCGYILRATGNPFFAIVAGIGLGALVGTVNGILTTKAKIPSFVSTYAMKWVLNGFALVLLGGKQIYDFGPTFRPLFISNKFTFFYIMLVILVVVGLVMKFSVFGKQVYATGHNPDAARISGIKTDLVTIKIYLMGGMIVGLVAVMYIANLGTAEPNIGTDFPINAIAAALIGGTAIGGGSGSVGKAIFGAMIILTLQNGMVQIGVPSVWQQVIVGMVILLSIFMERGLKQLAVKYEE